MNIPKYIERPVYMDRIMPYVRKDIMKILVALRSLQAGGGIDIFATGGNAKLLSGELATYLSGRYVEIKVYGLTYSEFLGLDHKIGRLL